ncbi:hypothetical protein [Paenibacillus taihuensis]|uniref:hypothetical protein n=1 Tax=Paenibacillus taihuensis TaxID=1156355 RepID=UPI001FEB3805|nr:hypothetical protein [Paenibacillus taihuensis]
MKKTSYYIAIAAIGVVLSSFYFHIQSDGAKERSSVALTNLSSTDKSINEVNSPLAGKTIVLDPGHGGKDVGPSEVKGLTRKTSH